MLIFEEPALCEFIGCGVMRELGFFFVILNKFLFLSATNFYMKQRGRNVLPRKLLIHKNALKSFTVVSK